MKSMRPALTVVVALLLGCQTMRVSLEQQAGDLPRLTGVMHAAAIRMKYPTDTNLPPCDIAALFGRSIAENPSLGYFRRELKYVRLCGGELVLMLCNPATGEAVLEDASCTFSVDRRWFTSNSPPRCITISHPETCGCTVK
jgi:hypothetical protein